MESLISKIDNNHLCLGCGFCESISGKDVVEMQLGEDGFFHPYVKQIVPETEKVVWDICPGLNVINEEPYSTEESLWGPIEDLWRGYYTDKEVRTKGSSGGVVSGLSIYMLEQKLVDAVLQVGGDQMDYERNSLKISKNREQVLACASSRYAPALIFDKIFEYLDDSDDTFCFIGKPCDVSALKNFLRTYPKYDDRFRYTISIMCAGLPSFNGTAELIDDFEAKRPVKDLVYRGNGWPGYFSFTDASQKTFQKSYNDSWGKTLNRHLNFRCKVCADGIGLQADFAIGDAWETKDGYPDFTEREGQSLIISRNKEASELLNQGVLSGSFEIKPMESEKIGQMQPYQMKRRLMVGGRIFATWLVHPVKLNYKNLGITTNLKKADIKMLFNEFKGTLKRVIKLRWFV